MGEAARLYLKKTSSATTKVCPMILGFETRMFPLVFRICRNLYVFVCNLVSIASSSNLMLYPIDRTSWTWVLNVPDSSIHSLKQCKNSAETAFREWAPKTWHFEGHQLSAKAPQEYWEASIATLSSLREQVPCSYCRTTCCWELPLGYSTWTRGIGQADTLIGVAYLLV